jgi:hypothetical protein
VKRICRIAVAQVSPELGPTAKHLAGIIRVARTRIAGESAALEEAEMALRRLLPSVFSATL